MNSGSVFSYATVGLLQPSWSIFAVVSLCHSQFLTSVLGNAALRADFKSSVTTIQVSVSLLLHTHCCQFLLIVASCDLSSYLVLSIINVRSHLSFLLQLGSSQPFESCSTTMEEAWCCSVLMWQRSLCYSKANCSDVLNFQEQSQDPCFS